MKLPKGGADMKRKRMTQLFPFLLSIRRTQRRLFFYAKMYFDRNHYAKTKAPEFLPFCIYETKSKLLNENTGFDMKYQENKVFNLRLAAEPVNGLLICPGETFSFWQRVRYAEKNERYKDGLCVVNGKLVTVPGGGLCHLSNLLFWLFLHTPLTIVERHPHQIKDFPSPDEDDRTVWTLRSAKGGWI
jgi:vancomycin resistance protein VanW